MDKSFCECYVNDLRTTTCIGVLGHRTALVPYFCHVFVAESYFWKYSRNCTKIFYCRNEEGSQKVDLGGGPQDRGGLPLQV